MLLNINEWVEKTVILGNYLPRITSPSLRLKNGSYDEKGLFSTEYFGMDGSDKWRQMYSVIELPHPILHPAIYYIIDRRISYLKKWINLSIGATKINNQLAITNESNNYQLCGISDIYDNPEDVKAALINSGKIETKAAITILENLAKKNKIYWTSYIIIPPPIYRPNDDDNAPYVKVLEELQVLRSAISSNDKILKNRLLLSIQLLHNNIFNAMIEKVKGKTGMVRGSLLGRNADFSGRAVIVGDPKIHPDQIGVPKAMLVRLFYPWIIHYILTHKDIANELSKYVSVNKPSLHTLINEKLLEEDIDDHVLEILYAVTAEVIKDKVVIAKRDPALHKLSVRSYYPVMVDDSSMHISPSTCPGHNADFDGDQMAIFVPLTKESQEEAIKKMLPSNNIWHPLGVSLSLVLEKDFPTAMYFITKPEPTGTPRKINNDVDVLSLIDKTEDFSQRIEYRGRVNSFGRRILEVICDDHLEIDYAVDAKKLNKLFEKLTVYGGKYVTDVIYKVQLAGGKITSLMGGDIGIRTFKLSPDLAKHRDDVLAHTDKYDVSKELSDITAEFTKRQSANGQFCAFAKEAGAKCDLQQCSVAKGYVSGVDGNVDPKPIVSNFADGFSSTDYFRSASGSRKGVIDRVVNTSTSGYLARQMVFLMSTVRSGAIKNCGTNHFVEMVLTEEMLSVLQNRVLDTGEILTNELAEKKGLINKVIRYYSPMHCKSRELCWHCFPKYYRDIVNNVTNVGVIAAHSVGERCTQLVMKTFHTGGASKVIYLATECPEVKGYIDQEGLDLFATKDIKIKILDPEVEEANVYSTRKFIIIDENNEETTIDFSAIIEFDGVAASEVKQNEDGVVILKFEQGTTIGTISATAADTNSATVMLQSIMDHADQFETPEQLVIELYETFKVTSKIPLIYFEMIVSQLARDPDRPARPYRLSNYSKEPMFVGIKRVPALESVTRGILFQKISDVLMNDIINGDDGGPVMPKSDMEKIFEL